MDDLAFVVLSAVLFALGFIYVAACARLQRGG
jgi:hypothetical protein